MSDLKNDLKKMIPVAQQGNDSMDQYLDAVGEILDGFNLAIDNFKYYSDYEKVNTSQIESLAGQFDIEFPRNMSTVRKREIIKDAIALYQSNGTERALKRIFYTLGWNVTIDYCWTLNPDVSGQVQYLYNGTITYDSSLGYTYNDLPVSSPVGLYSIIFGNEQVYSNGVYVDLYDSSGGFYPKNTIVGEVYDEYADTGLLVVVKVPYIRINVNEEDYNLFTQDYVDPDTGKIYSYDSTEQYEITQQVITYFLEQVRPANVSILEIVTPFALEDTFLDSMNDDSLLFSHIGEVPRYDGTISYGTAVDRYIMGEAFDAFQYGTNNINFAEPLTPFVISRSYPIGAFNSQKYIPTTKETQIDLTVPADASVTLYTTTSDRFALVAGTAVWQTYGSGTYSNVTNQIINISNKFAIKFNITNPSETTTIDAILTLGH